MDASEVIMDHKDIRGGGPEPGRYDQSRHERMRLKPLFIQRVFQSTRFNADINCVKCGELIGERKVIIGTDSYHYDCFGSK